MITNSKFNVDLASLPEKKLMYDFAKEMNFDPKASGKKSTRDRKLKKILNSPGLIVPASGVSKTIFLSSDPDELCNRLKLLLQERKAGNNSEIIVPRKAGYCNHLRVSVCLFVCLVAGFLINYLSDFDEIW